jgi:outer membrane usher protein
VQDGFALIRVPGVENVSAYLSNQYMGRTDSRGDLLLPNMLPYYGNQVRINDKDIPLDHAVDAMLKTVAPPLRGGAVIRFPVHRVQAFVGKLKINELGRTIIPKLGELKVNTSDRAYTSPIGNGGEFYLENIAPGKHAATIQYEDGECHFTIDLPDSTNQFVKLGTLACAATSIAATEKP